PLGGSYYVEALTDKLESEAEASFAEINRIGGVVRGIEMGWFQRNIALSAAKQQRDAEENRRVIVGVNEFVLEEPEVGIPLLKIGEEVEREQTERMRQLRSTRDNDRCRRQLDTLADAARHNQNVIPAMLECARSYCTLFEIREALEGVYGAYREPVFF
ncbi:MAG: methylmalonyl-CoA mutase family protein, partial [Gemmatimonadales bacterium]|nr:methylmalonyl-CoA mutase family protein [Gemmatimonadales bacterium]